MKMKYSYSILISTATIINIAIAEFNHSKNKSTDMNLGAFSISLTVKDLNASKEFYKKMGFEVFAGDAKMNYLILKNGDAKIGLFQGMFESNILTFNPGWDANGENLEEFDDIRSIHQSLKNDGITFAKDIEASESGPASFVIADPDGNVILIDQHR